MLEINKLLQKKEIIEEKKILNFNLGDKIQIKYYSKISGIQIRKFSGICISKKKNINKNNILITLLNNDNKEFLIFKFYLYWNQILSLEILNKNIINFKKAKLYYLL
jgi:ribosomal protein L19